MAKKNDNAEMFANTLKHAGVSLSSFLALHNMWLTLSEEERGKLIDDSGCF